MESCPECGKKHRRFPESCYSIARNVLAIEIIGHQASLVGRRMLHIEKTDLYKKVQMRMDRMDKYVSRFGREK